MTAEAVRKTLWRARMKARLELLRPWESAAIGERLRDNLRLVVGRRPGIWGTYHPLPFEADPTIGAVEGIEWVYPRMRGDSLVFCRGTSFTKGRFGITEPPETSATVAPEEMTGVLVPGLAFDSEGRRLGRGRGYYDRALAGYRGLTVGVAFSAQVVSELPADEWDVTLRSIVTENSVTEWPARRNP